MHKRLQHALEKIQALPVERQDLAALILEEVASLEEPYRLTEAERLLVREGLSDLEAGRIVSESEMDSFWNRHRS